MIAILSVQSLIQSESPFFLQKMLIVLPFQKKMADCFRLLPAFFHHSFLERSVRLSSPLISTFSSSSSFIASRGPKFEVCCGISIWKTAAAPRRWTVRPPPQSWILRCPIIYYFSSSNVLPSSIKSNNPKIALNTWPR